MYTICYPKSSMHVKIRAYSDRKNCLQKKNYHTNIVRIYNIFSKFKRLFRKMSLLNLYKNCIVYRKY